MSDLFIPTIRLTVEGMRGQIIQAFNEAVLGISEEIRTGVEQICTPEYVQATVTREIRSVLDAVVREEVERFYRTGAGRATVRSLVEEKLGTP